MVFVYCFISAKSHPSMILTSLLKHPILGLRYRRTYVNALPQNPIQTYWMRL